MRSVAAGSVSPYIAGERSAAARAGVVAASSRFDLSWAVLRGRSPPNIPSSIGVVKC